MKMFNNTNVFICRFVLTIRKFDDYQLNAGITYFLPAFSEMD